MFKQLTAEFPDFRRAADATLIAEIIRQIAGFRLHFFSYCTSIEVAPIAGSFTLHTAIGCILAAAGAGMSNPNKKDWLWVAMLVGSFLLISWARFSQRGAQTAVSGKKVDWAAFLPAGEGQCQTASYSPCART
jgi:hypothetical protein